MWVDTSSFPGVFVACSMKFVQKVGSILSHEFLTASDECTRPGNKARWVLRVLHGSWVCYKS